MGDQATVEGSGHRRQINASRTADLTPPAPLSNSALLRNAAWRGGSQKLSLRSRGYWGAVPAPPSPRSEAELERGVGGVRSPDLCTDEGGTRVSAYVARLSNKNSAFHTRDASLPIQAWPAIRRSPNPSRSADWYEFPAPEG